MRDDLGGATGELGAVVGPYTLAPVAVAAGLGGQQVKQRPTVPRVTGGTAPGQEPVVEKRAGPLHRDQDLVITADPGPVGGPAATLHVEAAVLVLQLLDDAGQPVGAVPGCQPRPDAVLIERLDGRQVGRLDAAGEQLLQVLGDIQHRRPGTRAV